MTKTGIAIQEACDLQLTPITLASALVGMVEQK